MILLAITFIIVVVFTSLATFVATRAWDHPPARMFAFAAGTLAVINVASSIQPYLTDPHEAYTLGTIIFQLLIIVNVSMLFLLSLLFAPHWWQQRCLICWLAPFYAMTLLIVMIDALWHTRLVFDGVRVVDSMLRVRMAVPGGRIFFAAMMASWILHLWLIVRAFIFFPKSRLAVILLAMAILISLLGDQIVAYLHVDSAFSTLFKSIPVTIAMANLVFSTRLLMPTEAALDLALEAVHEAVIVLDTENQVVYANAAARQLGMKMGEHPTETFLKIGMQPEMVATLVTPIPLNRGAEDGQLTLRIVFPDNRRMVFLRSPVVARSGRPLGVLLMGMDITEIDLRTEQLEQERARLAHTVRQLEEEQRQRNMLAETVRALSLPIIPVRHGVLVAPLIGHFDSQRMQEFTAVLLRRIERERAHLVLIDCTGVLKLGVEEVTGLVETTRAAALLGTRCVLVGVRPDIAQAIVSLGLPRDILQTAATLQQALQNEQRKEQRQQLAMRCKQCRVSEVIQTWEAR